MTVDENGRMEEDAVSSNLSWICLLLVTLELCDGFSLLSWCFHSSI